MSITGVGQQYANNIYQWQQETQSTQEDTASGNSSAAKSETTNKNTILGNGYNGKSTVASLVELTQFAMDAMGVKKGDRTTFSQIREYKESLEKEYSDTLKAAFDKEGVDPNVNFRLTQDSTGKIQVISDHADKAKIQKIFDENPELTQAYENIQALANLESARKSLSINPSEMRKRIQIESMAAWWQDSGNSTSSLGVFSGGGLNMMSGLNTTA